ncbi:MAG: hypothetical protein IJ111_07760, partial [Eggerthellaceae bacterium]|nr:hypothetical protein [Eggerthellaceae bacterium]
KRNGERGASPSPPSTKGIRGKSAACFFWQGLGNLNNGANAGLFYVNANNELSNANWNIGSRQSG